MLLEGVSVHGRLDSLFLFGSADYLLLNSPLCDNTIDGDRLGLTNSVDTILGLLIHGGIPIIIIEDHSVSSY